MAATLTTTDNSNGLKPEDRGVHDWYRFVLSYPPHLVREYLTRFGLGPGARVLDPFCGTGTTLVECKKRGLASAGVEANPVAALASSVKVDWDVSPDDLRDGCRAAFAAAERALEADGLSDWMTCRGLPATGLVTCDEDQTKLLLRNSISPLPLHKVLRLLSAIDAAGPPRLRDHLRLAVAHVATYRASNLRFGPEVGLGPRQVDVPVLRLWREHVLQMAADLEQHRDRCGVESEVRCTDSRSGLDVLPAEGIDAVITSPPYPNEKDYTRTTRLELVLLGYVRNMPELRRVKQSLVRSNTRSVYRDDDDDRWLDLCPRVRRLAAEIEARRVELGKTSGFERMYHRVTALYFGGMARHLAALRPRLRHGARLAYVVGDQASYFQVLIRTGELLGEIAAALGYEVEGLDLFRTRLATATKEYLNEEVLVLRWHGDKSTAAARDVAQPTETAS